MKILVRGGKSAKNWDKLESKVRDAMLVGIALLRSSGVLPACVEAARHIALWLGSDARWILVCIIQGSTETTFYVLAVYFGSVGLKNTRYAVSGGLIADLGGFTAAVLVAYWFFG